MEDVLESKLKAGVDPKIEEPDVTVTLAGAENSDDWGAKSADEVVTCEEENMVFEAGIESPALDGTCCSGCFDENPKGGLERSAIFDEPVDATGVVGLGIWNKIFSSLLIIGVEFSTLVAGSCKSLEGSEVTGMNDS